MGNPAVGSTAWYEEAADKLKAFSEEVQGHRDGLRSDSSEVVALAAEGPEALPEDIRKQEQFAAEHDARLSL